MNIINNGIVAILVELHKLTGNLGLSILLFTLLMRSVLLPLSIPALSSQKKIKQLQPEMDVLKKKHKGDKKALQMAQLELYKKYNINPLAGCLPQVVQIVTLLVLYSSLQHFLSQDFISHDLAGWRSG
jgi:YidC/Oxa1 family membrane protein insertase